MICFDNVSRSYGEKLAVDRLNLRVRRAELFALLGQNGAGKTTTIKMLVGLLRPTQGQVSVGGYDLVSHPREAASLIGYVPDQPFLYDKLTGREFLQFVAEMFGFDAERCRRCVAREIERFELGNFADQLTESYSHGMKQRTILASALLHDPQVLVIDEPLVGLDPHSIRLVKDLLRKEVAGGMSVFMSTHTLGVAEEVADRIGVMIQGRLLFEGPVEELRRQRAGAGLSLESLYLSLVDEQYRTAAIPDQPATTGDHE